MPALIAAIALSQLTPEEFLEWQIAHYTQRLAEAKTDEERSFLRQTLHNLKKKKDE